MLQRHTTTFNGDRNRFGIATDQCTRTSMFSKRILERRKILPFAVTTEGDASDGFKQVLAGAREEDMVTFTSVAGLPARAVATPWLKAYLKAEPRLQAVAHGKSRCTQAFDCLAQCGLRDGLAGWGQFCIDQQLAAALRGDPKKGLYFRGVGALPFGAEIRPVRDLLQHLLAPALALPLAETVTLALA